MDRNSASIVYHPTSSSKARNMFSTCMPLGSPSSKVNKLQKKQTYHHGRNASSLSIAATAPRPSFSPTIRLAHGQWGNMSQNALNHSPRTMKQFLCSERVELTWDRGSEPQIWGGFKDDEDMWIREGGCLVFFEETNMRSPPTPYFRLDATVISTSGLPFLVALLNAAKLPPSKKATHKFLATPKLSASSRKSLGYLPLVKSFSPLKFPDLDRKARRRDSERSLGGERQTWTGNDNRWSAFLNSHQAHLNFDAEPTEVTHELWFVLPDGLGTEDEHRRKLAIRNVLSILHGGSIVGTDLTRTLTDIHEILVTFSKTAQGDTTRAAASLIIEYIQSKQLHDVRDNLQHALCLLAWSEKSSVQWDLGYMESFVHIAGMMSPETVESAEFRQLSHITRTNLHNSHSGLQIILKEVEKKIQDFDFSEMWTLQKATSSPAKRAFDHFREFLIKFYTDLYGQWPPKPEDKGERWLNRDVIQRLQGDFGALYDFLVDKDVYWETLRAAYRREWEMACTDTGRDFSADLKSINMTDILVGFDDHHGLHHIPLPYPLLPDEDMVPSMPRAPSIFNSLKRREVTFDEEKQKFNMLMAFTSATNLARQSMFHADNELLSAFQTHEQSIVPGVHLQEARLGRWVLIYGALQFLSNVSVDVGGLQYTEDVSYLLCSSITGSPPWNKGQTPRVMTESTPLSSHCWTILDRLDAPGLASIHKLPRLSFLRRPSSSIYHEGLGLSNQAATESKVDARSWMPGEDQITLYTQPNTQIGSSRVVSNGTAKSEQSSVFPAPLSSHPTHGRGLSTATAGTAESQWTDANSVQHHSKTPRTRDRSFSNATATSQEAEMGIKHNANRLLDDRIICTANCESEWTDGDLTATTRQSVSTLREADAMTLPLLQRGRLTDVNRRDFALPEEEMAEVKKETEDDSDYDETPILSRGTNERRTGRKKSSSEC